MRKNGWVKRLVIVLCVIGVVALSGRAVLGSEWLKDKIVAQIRTAVARTTGPNYSFTMGQLNMDALRGDLSITDLALEPDTNLLDSLRKGHGQLNFPLKYRASSLADFPFGAR
jgi:hypothetical protein